MIFSILLFEFLDFSLFRRVRKQHIERMQRMVVKIQAAARGYIGRQRIRRIYKKLVKAKEKRIYDRRVKAATKIQGIVRRKEAMKVVKKKRMEFEERDRKRRQMEELDARLDDIHSSHLDDLLAVRVQQGIRGKLARKYVPSFPTDLTHHFSHLSSQRKRETIRSSDGEVER